ncbi:TonB-dependent receptor [Pseudoalteromonas sp. SMS1]|uniref:TonB-dependent receptor plug domain-containing protein n=1 Tax=Pseudoalteromonas sp. SMS1 TaxID=2908894 RepID=UPI001F3C4F8F|nr:TonB-dependent receptor [Pseudoalteromonas sp. SMS1]MCF2860316.1 TonB-dependent receptor [Pseudoalteromonas sp. SMS1]
MTSATVVTNTLQHRKNSNTHGIGLRQHKLSKVIYNLLFGISGLYAGWSHMALADANQLQVESNTQRYEAQYFEEFEPQTLYNMLENTPGANAVLIKLGDTQQARGFGSAGEPLLINGRRLSGKEINIESELTKIQAKDVEYIELIRGTSANLDVQSDGLVINVVLKEKINASLLASVGTVSTPGLGIKYYGSLIYSDSAEAFKYRVGIERDVNPNLMTTSDDYHQPNSQPMSHYERVRDNWYKNEQIFAGMEFFGAEKTTFNLNGLYAQSRVDSITETDIQDWIANEASKNALLYDWETEQWELSGDITHQLNSAHQLKLRFIANRADSNDQSWKYEMTGDQLGVLDYSFPRVFTTKETVLRANWKYTINDRHSVDAGFESAVNSHNENLQFIYGASGDKKVELNDIEEVRSETFINYNYTVSSDLNIQSSLIYERASIDVVTDVSILDGSMAREEAETVKRDNARTLSYIKPRLNVRYDIDAQYQARFNYVRTVSQLDLEDFVPWYNRDLSILEETNPDLKPEVRDELSVSLERQWLDTEGSFTVTPYYHDISDLLTEIPLKTRSGDGNIERGKEYGIELNTNFGLEAFGVENTLVSLVYTMRKSEMINPYTGQKTDIRRLSNNEWNVKIVKTDVLPGLSMSLAFENDGDFDFYRHDLQGHFDNKTEAIMTLDYQISHDFKLRVEGKDLFGQEYYVTRQRYEGEYTQSDISRLEYRRAYREPKYFISVVGQF